MPFKSKKQMRYMYSQKPEIAKEFAEKTTKKEMKNLPEKAKKKPGSEYVRDRNGLMKISREQKGK